MFSFFSLILNLLRSATLNDAKSPLLRLPAELRNQIYIYAIKSRPYEFSIIKPNSPNRRARIKHRANGVALAQVCRKLYHETAMLPFILNSFFCANWYVCEVLHKLLTPSQRAEVRELGVKVAGDRFWATRPYLYVVRDEGFRLSRHFPNLERVVVKSYYTVENTGARVRGIIEGKYGLLKKWFMKGEREGFEVKFEELNLIGGGKMG